MDEYFYLSQGVSQKGPPRPQQNLLQPHFVQQSRLVEPRERYRAIQHDYPMYDVVEDDGYGQGALLDTFDERMIQQSYHDRQHRAAQGRARLSLAPALSRVFDGETIEKQPPQLQAQPMYQELYDDRDQQAYPGNDARVPPNRLTYSTSRHLEPSSDVQWGASSSPALNAGRRRAGNYELNASRQPSPAGLFEDVPTPLSIDRRDDGERPSYRDGHPSRVWKHDVSHPSQQIKPAKLRTRLVDQPHVPPTVQGILLVPVSALPDRLRTVFPFPMFNAVQSKCFDQVYRSNDNFVLASPTGSGKTAILELAICRAMTSNTTGQYKIVYQAPTKALCAERQRDWDRKFTQIGLKCAELTGDSDASDLRNVQSANIIITTPEKWDSMTRKWRDHERLMKLVRLFLIDEVHILKEDRGAVLEVVVSRMKSIGTDVRFVALSATVPNFHDVASWLGKNSTEPQIPAPNERFGEEFRPVKLRKHVCGYVSNSNNDFAFEKQLDAKLPEIITKYSERKPMMIFCATRKSTVTTARLIANLSGSRSIGERLWNAPTQTLHVKDKDQREFINSGVAFHHAGLDLDDRVKVEKGFLEGEINVICCTSTLAVGVNLPCHLVIIKNTVSWTQDGLQEYSDLEMMQMLGRAGRPQFDDSAVAVIMTRQTKVQRYETLVTGEEVLESKLHLNLIGHMNAEIGLGTIRDLDSARRWLTGTFLYVRLQQNPVYYKLEGSRSGQSIQEQVDDICFRDITLLREHNLATGEDYFRSTEYGHAMARYYVHFETMKVFMGLQPKATLSEILSAMSQASEFSKIRFRQGEKSLYKMLNKSPSIRYPIPVNLDLPAHKVSLIIQSALGSADISWDGDMNKHKSQHHQEELMIFKSISSLIRCIIDCQICCGDSVSIHSALMLERSLGSRAWDDSPLQMKQVPNIGTVAVRKLVNAGIRGIEDLEGTDARRIETIVGRNPPFGLKILDALKSYPKLRLSLHVQPSSVTKTAEGVKVQVKAEFGFMNEKPPEKFGSKLIYVCMLAETSDGRKVHFARINGLKLGAGQSLVFPALLTSPNQNINCYLMCEGIAGSMRGATVTPKIALSTFPPQASSSMESALIHQPNMSRRRIENIPMQRKKSVASDDFGDADIDDDALCKATCSDLDFEHIDNFATPVDVMTRTNTTKNKSVKEKEQAKAPVIIVGDNDGAAPIQLPNGRWACSHKCKDKEACKHYCCKHGMDKPPKKTALKRVPVDEHQYQSSIKDSVQLENRTQTKLQLQASKRKSSAVVEELDLTSQEKKRKTEYAISGPRDYRDLHHLHKNIQKTAVPSSIHSVMHKKPAYCYGEGGEHQLSFLSQPTTASPKTSSEYGDLQLEEFVPEPIAVQTEPTYSDELASLYSTEAPIVSRRTATLGDQSSLFNGTVVDLTDSQDLQTADMTGNSHKQSRDVQRASEVVHEFSDIDFPVDIDFTIDTNVSSDLSKPVAQIYKIPPSKTHAFIFEARDGPKQQSQIFRNGLQDLQRGKLAPPQLASTPKNGPEEDDALVDQLKLLGGTPVMEAENLEQNISIKHDILAQPVEIKEEERKQAPELLRDLRPWLFQEFGDIVELVDE